MKIIKKRHDSGYDSAPEGQTRLEVVEEHQTSHHYRNVLSRHPDFDPPDLQVPSSEPDHYELVAWEKSRLKKKKNLDLVTTSSGLINAESSAPQFGEYPSWVDKPQSTRYCSSRATNFGDSGDLMSSLKDHAQSRCSEIRKDSDTTTPFQRGQSTDLPHPFDAIAFYEADEESDQSMETLSDTSLSSDSYGPYSRPSLQNSEIIVLPEVSRLKLWFLNHFRSVPGRNYSGSSSRNGAVVHHQDMMLAEEEPRKQRRYSSKIGVKFRGLFKSSEYHVQKLDAVIPHRRREEGNHRRPRELMPEAMGPPPVISYLPSNGRLSPPPPPLPVHVRLSRPEQYGTETRRASSSDSQLAALPSSSREGALVLYQDVNPIREKPRKERRYRIRVRCLGFKSLEYHIKRVYGGSSRTRPHDYGLRRPGEMMPAVALPPPTISCQPSSKRRSPPPSILFIHGGGPNRPTPPPSTLPVLIGPSRPTPPPGPGAATAFTTRETAPSSSRTLGRTSSSRSRDVNRAVQALPYLTVPVTSSPAPSHTSRRRTPSEALLSRSRQTLSQSSSSDQNSNRKPSQRYKRKGNLRNGEDRHDKRIRVDIESTAPSTPIRLACLYNKLDPMWYRSTSQSQYTFQTCGTHHFEDMHRVLEHLKAVHTKPPLQCPRCTRTDFTRSEQLQAHQMSAEPCALVLSTDVKRTQWLAPEQCKKLRAEISRNLRGCIDAEKWEFAYHWLFPGIETADVPSPYYEDPFISMMTSVADNFERRLRDVLQKTSDVASLDSQICSIRTETLAQFGIVNETPSDVLGLSYPASNSAATTSDSIIEGLSTPAIDTGPSLELCDTVQPSKTIVDGTYSHHATAPGIGGDIAPQNRDVMSTRSFEIPFQNTEEVSRLYDYDNPAWLNNDDSAPWCLPKPTLDFSGEGLDRDAHNGFAVSSEGPLAWNLFSGLGFDYSMPQT